VTLLNDRARQALDWRSRPYLVLGLAALGGFMIARWVRPRPTPGERVAQALTDNLDNVMHALGEGGRPRTGLVRAGAAALAAVAARSAAEWAVRHYLEDGRAPGKLEESPERRTR
jgi:hypothetical protein